MIAYTYHESQLGLLLLVSDGWALTGLTFEEHRSDPAIGTDWLENAAATPFPLAKTELDAYFAGKLRVFHVPLSLRGTPFQLAVWQVLREIPYGMTISYSELARRVGRPNSARAAGQANGCNPMAIVIPCHRVIGSNSSLTGYGGGLQRKGALLKLERQGHCASK
jgi:methylated-DNA-[protein]-cysteine S-methyltransferase